MATTVSQLKGIGKGASGGRLLWNPVFLGEAEPMTLAQSQDEIDRMAMDSAARMEQIQKRMASAVKREMLKTAAAQTSISVSLAFIPIVGPVLSLVASAIFAVDQRKYKKRIENETRKAEETITREWKALEDELQVIEGRILDEEIQNAHNEILAELSGGMDGFDGLGLKKLVRRAARSIRKTVKNPASIVKRARAEAKRQHDQIVAEIKRTPKNLQNTFDTIRGKAGYAEVREKVAEMMAENRRAIAEMREAKLAQYETEEYRLNVRRDAKAMLLSDPEYIKELQNMRTLMSQASAGVQDRALSRATASGGNLGTLALLGAAGFAAFMLMR